MTDNKPVYTFNEGLVRASIFFNENEMGGFYDTTFSRIYRTSQNSWAYSQSFGELDLAALEKCVQAAYSWIQANKETDAPEVKLPALAEIEDKSGSEH